MRELRAAIANVKVVGAIAGDGDVFRRGASHIDLHAGAVIHHIVGLCIEGKLRHIEQDVQAAAAGAEFRVAVQQRHNLGGLGGEISGVGDAVVEVDGAERSEDPNAEAAIAALAQGGGIV